MSSVPILYTDDPDELNDSQRAQLIAKAQEDPYFSHVKAARAIGVQGTAGHIRDILAHDEPFQEALAEARRDMFNDVGLTVRQMLANIAKIANATDGSSALRANVYGLSFHGVYVNGERNTVDVAGQVEHTGADGGPIQLEGRAVVGLADVVRLATELGYGHLVGVDAGDPRPELAAAPDVLPGP